jgi:YfiH family protein
VTAADPITAANLPVRHGFFTRLGGFSTGPFASLNCSLSSHDDRDIVLRNRAIAAHALSASEQHLVGLMQIHSADCVEVTSAWEPGAGPRADAMVTRVPGIALGIITADCAPVLFVDPASGIIGAAHAGWRGAVAGVLESTVDTMRSLGATKIHAAIGPCIGPASYEVGPDLRAAVLAHATADQVFFAPGRHDDRWQFNLAGYCAHRLAEYGVTNIATISADTCTDEQNFFSHRAPDFHYRSVEMPYLIMFCLLLLLSMLVSCVL